jgi:hypothetical protein
MALTPALGALRANVLDAHTNAIRATQQVDAYVEALSGMDQAECRAECRAEDALVSDPRWKEARTLGAAVLTAFD